MRDRLQGMLQGIKEGWKAQQNHLNSEEGARAFDMMWLRQSHLVQVLAHIASNMARPDGWTLLSNAGHLARDLAGDDIRSMAERFGHKSLKRLLIATELFDVVEEPTTGEHTRTIYRLKQPPNVEI